MNDELENQDSLNPKGEQDTISETESNETPEELAKAKEYGINQKIRAEKAEKEAKTLKAELAKHNKSGESETPKKEEKSNEPDYTKEMVEDTFMEAKGVTLDLQKEFLRKEAKDSGKPLKEVLKYKYVQEELKNLKDQIEAEAGMPESSGKSGGKNKGSVDYWVGKKKSDGTFDTPSDLELANKVIDARIKQQSESKKFSEELYVG